MGIQARYMGTHPLYHALSRRGLLDPIKLAHMTHVVGKPVPPAPSSQCLKQLCQYASSPGHRGSCYAELAVFFPSGGRTHC